MKETRPWMVPSVMTYNWTRVIFLVTVFFVTSNPGAWTVDALAASLSSSTAVSSLLSLHSKRIQALKEYATDQYPNANLPQDDLFYLRFCLLSGAAGGDESQQVQGDEYEKIKKRLENTMEWRSSEQGKRICDAAQQAFATARSTTNASPASSTGWYNEPVRNLAPHASIVNKYITPNQCLTTTLNTGDLIYCISAGRINDVSLMQEISVTDLTEFFLYTKEILSLVCNTKSLQNDRLVKVLTANDLSGVKLIGSDATFRKVIGLASTKANELYPNLNGPTFLLNLPPLVNALVKLFTPLFPEEVRKRIKFAQGPLKEVKDMMKIAPNGGDAKQRMTFLSQMDELLMK